jgi:indolepyruvate ferredoxin oxidoreductase alpha subunit
MADANEPVLKPVGLYFDSSGNEAAAAALLGVSINYPIRGAAVWKSTVGTNVASDPIAHLASSGVVGGTLIIVGEDYGVGASALQERTYPFAMKSTMCLVEPRANHQHMARLVETSFDLSEASHMPVLFGVRIRSGHMRDTMVCKDNRPPKISMLRRLEAPVSDLVRVPLPPMTHEQERLKFTERIPAAQRFIRARRLNERFGGARSDLGIICHGGVHSMTMRALHLLGEADLYGRTDHEVLCLNLIHPLIPEEILDFLRRKRAVLIVEEGMPNLLEHQIRALAQEHRLSLDLHGKDLLVQAGEYKPEVIIEGMSAFLAKYQGRAVPSGSVAERRDRLFGHLPRVKEFLRAPISKRPPAFCTGCPERPVFSAIKIMERQTGPTYAVGDIGCHTFGALAPFHVGSTVLGYGMGLASANALSRVSGKRPISIMGDGGFWHSGLTTGVANAVFNKQDTVLVILENFYTAATGQQDNPSTGKNLRGERTNMSIQAALKGVGVEWLRIVNPYDVTATKRTLTEAMESDYDGLKVVIARAECQLEKGRRERGEIARKLKARERVERPKFGVDPDVCTGDHSCMRLNGCPSLTLAPNPDPLRDDPIAHVEDSCVGCGLCGEVAHAAVLCPSFYEVKVVTHPGRFERLRHRLNRFLIGMFMGRNQTNSAAIRA